MILGAHVRRRQAGIAGAVDEAVARGADAFQIFISNPRSWAGPRYDDAQIQGSHDALAASGLRPCVAHLSYVGIVASWDPTTLRRTRELLIETGHAYGALAWTCAADTCGRYDDEVLTPGVVAWRSSGPRCDAPEDARARSEASGLVGQARPTIGERPPFGSAGAGGFGEPRERAVDQGRSGMSSAGAHGLPGGKQSRILAPIGGHRQKVFNQLALQERGAPSSPRSRVLSAGDVPPLSLTEIGPRFP